MTKEEAGFSLVEIIVGISLVMVLFTLAIIQAGTLDISRRQRHENIAYHVANKQMEDLRSTAFENLLASGVISDSLLSQIPSGSGNYTVTDYAGYSDMKKITVTVTWNDGAAKSTVLETLATDHFTNP